ncbi:heme A synthase [Nocardioides sp.]|uniref:COX15/CtaA family protein n=1 Tax=Nocardioides sp. TaxID=35761 RepID=UPI0035656038
MDRLEPRLVPLAWATLVANATLVVTGGAVRLTASGLGCPTWPRCTFNSMTPETDELTIHAAIEFGNRLLTFVLVAIAVATVLAAWRSPTIGVRRLSVVLALGIPAQAILGGVTVLTDLNPWVVSGHLLVSLAIIGLAVLLLRRLGVGGPIPQEPGASRLGTLAWATFAATWVVLYLGTVVTGSGPHAGDPDSPRNGLDPQQFSQLHADAVFLLVGLTLGLVLALRASGGAPLALRAAVALLVIELAQGAIGFVQYYTDLPILLVGLHMLGAALISASVTWTLIRVREGA